jgi:methyl-accepting chemotaxis protein
MTVSDLTIELLKQIRDAAYETNARLDQTRTDLSAKIDQTNARLDQTHARLDQTRTDLSAKIDQTRVEFLVKLDQVRVEVTERIDQTNVRVGRLEHSTSQIVEHLGTIVDRGGRLADDVADLRRRVEILESARE